MSEPVKPALTPEQWAKQGKNHDPFHIREDGALVITGVLVTPGQRNRLAALCLYGQPFGFSQEDVEALRLLASALLAEATGDWEFTVGGSAELHGAQRRAQSLAERISALLPPSDSEVPDAR